MNYQPRKQKGETTSPLRAYCFKEFNMSDGTKIGVFQGGRGEIPDLDILIKFQQEGKRVRTPAHIHWVVDLLIKKEHNKELTLEFVRYLRDMYDRVERFSDKEDQQRCELKETTREKLEKFKPLDEWGYYDVEFIGHLIELMIKMEKNHKKPFVFKKLMDSIIDEKDIFSICAKAIQKRR